MKTVSYELNVFSKKYEMVVNTKTYSPDESEFQICRFCGETNPEKFKSVAHLIPEFTGNKELKYYAECDSCNNKFSKYERNLSLYGGIKNIIAGIKGKKYPKHIDKKNGFKIESKKGVLNIYNYEKSNALKIQNGKFTISSETQKFKPRFVQKALVKIALSMMDKSEMYKFKKTLEWLSIPEDEMTIEEHPIFILIERENSFPLKKPAAMLMKKVKEHNSPEYALLFYYSFFAFQIWIPFNEKDSDLDYDNLSFPLSTLVVTDLKNLKEVKFNHYHMTKLEKVKFTDEFETKFKQLLT